MQEDNSFKWAVGIENTFIPQTQPGLRALDEYELTQHYRLWREDFDRIADLGISHIRWGVPWYRVNPAPGEFDWAWVDEVLDYLVIKKGIQPILDLMHYGAPLWLEECFLNVDYPRYVAQYAHAFAKRYQDLVHIFTPLNEPTINAKYCGRLGQWPPYQQDERGYVKVLLALVRGMIQTARAVRAVRKDALFVQVEALGWHWTADASLKAEVSYRQAHSYLAFDLLTGRVNTQHDLWPYLQEHGVTETDLAWFEENACTMDVLGVNVYPWSGGELRHDGNGEITRHGELSGYHLREVLRDAWQRYQLPVMVTETSAHRDIPGRAQWMDKTIDAVREACVEGIPVQGYTWFPAFTMIDWDYRLGSEPLEHYLIHLGLWESSFDENDVLRRHETPLVSRFRNYVERGIDDKFDK